MVFVDTGGWIAMAVKRDRYHKKAATYYRKLSKDKVRLVTSNYVLAEEKKGQIFEIDKIKTK